MKKNLTLTILMAFISISVFSSNYHDVMKLNIEKMKKSTSSVELGNIANQFERIAKTEKEEWLPGYYAAYSYLRSTFFDEMGNEDTHIQLDKAQAILDELTKKFQKQSEIFTLQAFVYQLRITDMSKGYKYSKLAAEAIGVAEKLDPQNPRIYYLRGSNIYHTSKMFGGGKENAKPELEKAAKMFESYQPENDLLPSWGAAHNSELLKQCS